MNSGKTLFAQLMDFLPWSTFTRIVARYRGDQRVRTLSCAEHYRAMAFAQLTYRESLRDIETCFPNGFLQAARDNEIEPDLVTATSGQIVSCELVSGSQIPRQPDPTLCPEHLLSRYCFYGTMTTRINFV